MPTFDTPEPISVELELSVGDVRVVASERADTVVRVEPNDPHRDADVRVAGQTRVEYAAGRLLVKAPKQRGIGLFNKIGSIDVTIELPAGSGVQTEAAISTFRATGRLGDTRIKTATGDLRFEQVATLDAHTGIGVVEADRVAGGASVNTGSGRVRLGSVGGEAAVKNSNGDTWVGEVGGDLRVKNANGDVTVDSAGGGVTANTANGSVRVGTLVRGRAELKTALGTIEVGIRAGTAARLDAYTHFGRVDNRLETVDSPEPSDETVEVQARTSYGDIVIRRAGAPAKEHA